MGLVNLSDLPELEIAPGIKAHAITTDKMTVVHVKVDAGATFPEHSHSNEEVINMIEGEFELTANGVTHNLVAGKVMVLSPNVSHSGHAISDCRTVNVFYPIREDFRGSFFGGYKTK